MKDIIKELVDIDEQAKLYSEETKKQKEALEKEIEEEVQKIQDKYKAEAKEEVELKKQDIEKKSADKFNINEEKRKAAMSKLQRQFDENFEKWVNEIVEDVLK